LLYLRKDGTSTKEPCQNETGQGKEAKGGLANRLGLFKIGSTSIQQVDKY
jgi:hypothetical protein